MLNVLDIIFLILLGVFALIGFMGGALKRIFLYGGMILGFALAPLIGPYIVDFLSDTPVAGLLTSSILLVLSIVGMGLVGRIVGKILSIFLPPPLKLFDRLGGLALGVLLVCIFAWFTLSLIRVVPGKSQELEAESKIAGFFESLPEPPIGKLLDSVRGGKSSDIQETINDNLEIIEQL